MFNDILGSDQETKHTPPDLGKDIEAMMQSLTDHKVYTLYPGQVFNDKVHLAKDVIEVGFGLGVMQF